MNIEKMNSEKVFLSRRPTLNVNEEVVKIKNLMFTEKTSKSSRCMHLFIKQ